MTKGNRRPIDYRVLREMIGPRDALRILGWTPTWARGELARGPCPIHGSRSPGSRSLVVSVQVVYCHKCKYSGDAVDIIARVRQLPKLEAAYQLCEELRISPPYLT